LNSKFSATFFVPVAFKKGAKISDIYLPEIAHKHWIIRTFAGLITQIQKERFSPLL